MFDFKYDVRLNLITLGYSLLFIIWSLMMFASSAIFAIVLALNETKLSRRKTILPKIWCCIIPSASKNYIMIEKSNMLL